MKIISIKETKFVKGFSLIELLMAVSIFSVITIIAVGALYSVQNINTRTQQSQAILDGMNLSMEQMLRDIRYGSTLHCGGNIANLSSLTTRLSCPFPSDPGNILVFKPHNGTSGDRIAYYISDGHIMKLDTRVSSLPTQITSNDVIVSTLHFFVEGASSVQDNDYKQPLVTIVVSGETVPAKINIVSIKFSLQTSVSSRLLDN